VRLSAPFGLQNYEFVIILDGCKIHVEMIPPEKFRRGKIHLAKRVKNKT